MFHIQTERKSLRFCFEKLSPLPNTVIGDEKRLRQILINVLSNAVKFTATGEVKLSVRYRNQVAEFKVYDSGIGIDEDDLDRIFKPFERIRKPGYTDVIGTGLGLTITRLLTDIMGGEISYSKNPDGGSIFTVSLMLSTIYLPENEKIKSRAIVGYKGPRKFALVVDDDATHRGLTSDLLTPLGFSVAEAHDGESCLKMVCNFSPDVFLIDRKMQDIDGLELASRLRDRGFDVPILIISANAQDNQKQTEAGVEKNQINVLPYDDYINKPIKLDFLLAQLAKHLEIQWLYEDDKVLTNKLIQREESLSKSLISENSKLIDQTTKDELTEALAIGSLKIITQCLNKIAEYPTINAIYVNNLRRLAKEIKFDQILIYISETEN